MKNLSTKVVVLTAVAVLALVGLAVLAIVSGRYDALLVGLIGVAGVGVSVVTSGAQTIQAAQLKKIAAKQDKLLELAKGIGRLEDTVASSPRMLEGSQERQIAETAARFDWLARRHVEQAERLDAFLDGLESTLARRHQELLEQLRPGSTDSPDLDGLDQRDRQAEVQPRHDPVDAASSDEPDRGSAGTAS